MGEKGGGDPVIGGAQSPWGETDAAAQIPQEEKDRRPGGLFVILELFIKAFFDFRPAHVSRCDGGLLSESPEKRVDIRPPWRRINRRR